MQLSPNFSLAEMSVTTHTEVNNTPPEGVVPNLVKTAQLMEHIRTRLGSLPIKVNSGYRCPELNKIVGGSPTSDHPNGLACDWTCAEFGTPLEICEFLTKQKDLMQLIDQVIEEGTWVHVGIGTRMRHEVLTKSQTGGYTHGLPE